MTLEKKFKIVRSIGEECIQEDELMNLLAKKPQPICYDGFEPSGRMHIAQVCKPEFYPHFNCINEDDKNLPSVWFAECIWLKFSSYFLFLSFYLLKAIRCLCFIRT